MQGYCFVGTQKVSRLGIGEPSLGTRVVYGRGTLRPGGGGGGGVVLAKFGGLGGVRGLRV